DGYGCETNPHGLVHVEPPCAKTSRYARPSRQGPAEMCRIKSSGHCAILFGEIEGKDTVRSVRALQHLRMTKRADCIVVTGLPVLLHRAAGKLVILGATFIILGAVDELYEIVDLLIRKLRQPLGLRRLQQVLG